MFQMTLVPLLFLACADEETVAAPSLTWLSPVDGDTVTAGDLDASVVVDGFTLEDPAKHTDGVPEGYVAISVDGAEVLQVGSTTFTLPLEAGSHELMAQLFYIDGDEVLASDVVCDEDTTDAACAPVEAMITVTAQ